MQSSPLRAAAPGVHGGPYATYPEAREERQRRLGDAVKRWREEERRLFALMKTFKERARYSSDWAKKADAAETRWRRFRDAGPPPAPGADRSITVRIRGGDSARRVLDLRALEIDGLVDAFSDEIHFGERVGVIGPNGSGKTQLMRVLAGVRAPDAGELVLGPRGSRRVLHPAAVAHATSPGAPCSRSCSSTWAGAACRRPWARWPATGWSTPRGARL